MTSSGKHRVTTITVPEDAAGQRLDRVLADVLGDTSRSRVQALISDGLVAVNGTVVRTPSRKFRGTETVTITVPPPRPVAIEAQPLPLDIVFEDDDLIVLNKPAGLVVHPAPGTPDHTLVNALLAHCGDSLRGIGGEKRPGIVHRIDKDTSGLMVVAKSQAAHAGLAEQFKAHTLERVYTALVWGHPAPPSGTITGNIGRDPRNRKKMAVLAHGGKPAITHYRTLNRFAVAGKPVAALVECRLETGRTHQIRVHLTSAGHPLVGDPVYGRQSRHIRHLPETASPVLQRFPRQALHAGVIGFAHPVTGKTLTFEADLPSDMKDVIRILESF